MKLLHGIAAAAIVIAASGQALAATALKKVQVTDGSQLDLLFDGKIARGQVKAEFFNDIIQLSLTDVSVYPAKIFSVQGSDLTKVFAYQYAPKLVRTRLTVKGKAEDYKDRLQMAFDGKMMTVRLGGVGSDQIASASARSLAQSQAPAQEKQQEARKMTDDEKILLEKVIKGTPGEGAAAKADARADAKSESKDEKGTKDLRLGSGNAGPSLAKSFGMLILVLGAFAGLALFLKRLRSGAGKDRLNGRVGKFIRAGFGSKEKMIDMVANHYLGPKKSIAVVRIGTKLLVLGVTNESINLITQLPDSASPAEAEAVIAERMEDLALGDFMVGDDRPSMPSERFTANVSRAAAGAAAQGKYGSAATSAGKAVFADVLDSAQAKPSVRAQIKSRLEGMKQL